MVKFQSPIGAIDVVVLCRVTLSFTEATHSFCWHFTGQLRPPLLSSTYTCPHQFHHSHYHQRSHHHQHSHHFVILTTSTILNTIIIMTLIPISSLCSKRSFLVLSVLHYWLFIQYNFNSLKCCFSVNVTDGCYLKIVFSQTPDLVGKNIIQLNSTCELDDFAHGAESGGYVIHKVPQIFYEFGPAWCFLRWSRCFPM